MIIVRIFIIYAFWFLFGRQKCRNSYYILGSERVYTTYGFSIDVQKKLHYFAVSHFNNSQAPPIQYFIFICCQVSILESTQSCRVMLHFTFHTLHAKLRTCQYLIDKNHFRTNYFAIVEITKVTTEGSNGYNSRNIWF